MRYAILSDIHGNLEALRAALRESARLQAQSVLCLGDVVGYGANPNECVALLRQIAAACVRGNHDSVAAGLREPDEFSPLARHAIAWTKTELNEASRRYLEMLPLVQEIDGFVLVHAALHPEANDDVRIRDSATARESLLRLLREFFPKRLCFFGHTHRPGGFAMPAREDGEVSEFSGGEEIQLDQSSLYLINPGSVGQSRDADPRGSFVLYDSEAQSVKFQRFSYDHRASKARLRVLGLLPRQRWPIRALRVLVGRP